MRTQAEAVALVTPHTLATPPITPKATLERDLEGLILAAAEGSILARRLLKPAIYRIAKSETIYVEDAENVAKVVFSNLGHPEHGVGKPRPGSAVAWLENVTRYYAKHDFELRSFEEWEAWEEEDEEPQ